MNLKCFVPGKSNARGLWLSLIWTVLVAIPYLRADAQAPDFSWVKIAGGNPGPPPSAGGEWAHASVVSPSGDVYEVGHFDSLNPVFVGSNLTNSLVRGGFIARYGSEGRLIWARSIGTNASFETVAADSLGNVYAAGSMQKSNTFGEITLTNNLQNGAALLVKYDPFGNVLWATQAVNAHFSRVAAITVDAQDNLYITGSYFTYSNIVFGTQVLFDGGSYTGQNALYDVFTIKYAPNGESLWARRVVGLHQMYGGMITVDSGGNIFLTTPFQKIADFGGVTLTNIGPMDLSLVKYDASGNLLWAKRAAVGDFGYVHHTATDPAGNVYLSSFFDGQTASFGNTTLTNNSGVREIFLAKYDKDGNFLWIRPGKPSNGFYTSAGAICLDVLGNSYFAGSFDSTSLAFGDVILSRGSGWDSLFVVKHDPDGNLLWAKTPANADSAATGVGVDGKGNVYLTGYISTGVWDFGNLSVTNGFYDQNSGYSWWVVLVARLDGPKLSLKLDGNQLITSWPTNAAGLHLESSISLGGPWSAVTNSVVVNGNQKTIATETSGASQFFRLNGP